MNKIKLALIGIIVILFVFPSLFNAQDDEYEIRDLPAQVYMQQPKTLDGAVDQIRQMIKDRKPRWYIAKRVAIIADLRITNKNDEERLTIVGNLLESLCGESDADRKFKEWRDVLGGGDKQYYDIAEWAWNNRYGQCKENACLVYYLLKKAKVKNICLFSRDEPDHMFVVWGMHEEVDPNDPKNWTKNVIVPDSWQHQVLPGKKAWGNWHCGQGGRGPIDQYGIGPLYDSTHLHHKGVRRRCGFPSIEKLGKAGDSPCCQNKDIGPCRNNPKLVCKDGICVWCGKLDRPCCKDDKCLDERLECKDGKCVEKCPFTKEDCICPGLGMELHGGAAVSGDLGIFSQHGVTTMLMCLYGAVDQPGIEKPEMTLIICYYSDPKKAAEGFQDGVGTQRERYRKDRSGGHPFVEIKDTADRFSYLYDKGNGIYIGTRDVLYRENYEIYLDGAATEFTLKNFQDFINAFNVAEKHAKKVINRVEEDKKKARLKQR